MEEYSFICKLSPELIIQLPGGRPMQRALAPLSEEGVDIEVTIRKHRRNRTNRQNRYIHGVIVPTVSAWVKNTQGTKISHDECYYMLRQVVGDSLHITTIAGMQVISLGGKRFSAMNTLEFSDAIEKIKGFYSPKGCDIPDPVGENYLNSFL